MTDRLTPAMLRDLAALVGQDYLGTRFSEEAARREAEATQGPLSCIEAGPDAVHPKPPVEGPGNTAAPRRPSPMHDTPKPCMSREDAETIVRRYRDSVWAAATGDVAAIDHEAYEHLLAALDQCRGQTIDKCAASK